MMVDERIAERRRDVREEQRRRRLQRTVVVAVLVGLLVALLLVERSPLVELAEVRVVGTQVLDDAEVRAAADLPLGTSLLRLPLGDAEDRVAALPRVRSVDIDRVDPVTVEIAITERVATIVARTDDTAVLVDDEGMVMATKDADGLVVIDVEEGELPAPGERALRNPALGNAIDIAAALPGPTASLVASIDAQAADRAVLVLDDGTRVQFGRATDVDAKSRALAAVLEDLDGATVSGIDVRAPDAPVVDP
ncbi:cell division protein FtsQ/DivIB [Salsipaludibacter albus]|uniref:cell division protein FtsQ/DivIB n=1 Tax=Salsipaludibacter albus TaxID=2849650 RepID=UPI001EE3BD4D|nr:FtsQ-type POTRA domain-containing protein [Salsipaludibacter albus]MBY5163213.1 FtsQ-type POTRA domain-containing protein [Salsipaludibacter albus]